MKFVATLFLTLALFASPLHAAPGQPAPDWDIETWFNSPPLKIADLKGKIVIVEFFQMLCPGCRTFSMPIIKSWEHRFRSQIKAGELKIISIHTVFEAHPSQSNKRLEKFLKERKINHPVGVDRHEFGEWKPQTMRAWKTKGTPEIAIIDKKGIIRFQKFGRFEVWPAIKLIQKLLRE